MLSPRQSKLAIAYLRFTKGSIDSLSDAVFYWINSEPVRYFTQTLSQSHIIHLRHVSSVMVPCCFSTNKWKILQNIMTSVRRLTPPGARGIQGINEASSSSTSFSSHRPIDRARCRRTVLFISSTWPGATTSHHRPHRLHDRTYFVLSATLIHNACNRSYLRVLRNLVTNC